MPDHPTSTSNKVVNIRTRRPFHPAHRTVEPPAEELEKFAQNGEPDDFKHRMLVNLIAFGFVTLLVISALWLANSLATMQKDQDCVLSGKRGCTPVETPVKAR
jgi:hypothetical protein